MLTIFLTDCDNTAKELSQLTEETHYTLTSSVAEIMITTSASLDSVSITITEHTAILKLKIQAC